METEKLIENINEINSSISNESKDDTEVKEIDNLMEKFDNENKVNEVNSSVEPPKKNDTIDLEDEAIDIDQEIASMDKTYDEENNDILPNYKSSPDYEKMEFDEDGNLVAFINKIDLSSSSPVDEFNFNDENMRKVFFGKTGITVKKEEPSEVKSMSILDALDVITKSGEYVDTYMPMSNIVIRTYEFENDIVMGTTLGSITQDYDFKNSVNPNAILSKRFIDKIVEYSEIIASDSRRMTEKDLENISNKDIELLILNVAKLLAIDYTKSEDKKNEPITAEVTMDCPKCGNRNKLVVDFNKLIKDNYTKEVISFANENLKLGETIESNLSRSNTMRARGCRYIAKDGLGVGKDLMILVKLKDPSYAKSLLIENRILPYILEKYEKTPFFSDLVDNNNYLSSPMRGKLTLMFRYVQSQLRFADINDAYSVSVDFSQDLDKLYLISYVDSIMSVVTEKGKEPKASDKVVIMNKLKEENTLENPSVVKNNIDNIYETFNKLPKSLLTKLQSKINEMEKESIFKFNVHYKCALTKCGHEGEKEILPIDLVFSILQRLSEK